MNVLLLIVFLILGILAAQHIPLSAAIIFAVVFLFVCLIRARLHRPHNIDMIVAAAVFILGIVLCKHAVFVVYNQPLDGHYVTAYGRITAIPYKSSGTYKYIVDIRAVDEYDIRSDTDMRVYVTSAHEFHCGDDVRLFGQLRTFDDRIGEFEYDSHTYYAVRSIHLKMHALEADFADSSFPCPSLYYYSNLARSHLARIIDRGFEGDAAAAMKAVVTGDKRQFSDKYTAVLRRTGVKHLFYPAFVHILLITSAIGMLSHIVHRRHRDIILFIVLSSYMMFSISNISSLKSAGTIILTLLSGRLTGIRDSKKMLHLFIFLSCVLNPLIVFDDGFIYTCGSSIMLRAFANLPSKRAFLRRFLVLTLGTLPLSAYCFGSVSVFSVIASFIFTPCLILIICLSPFAIAGCVLPLLHPFTGIANKIIMTMLRIPILLDSLSLSEIQVIRPTPIITAAACFIIAAVYFRLCRSYASRICAVIAAGLIASQIVCAIPYIDKMEIEFIDVGQGDAALIHIPFSGNILIDGGGSSEYSDYDTGKYIFVPHLNERGVNIVQAAFVSHYHRDHTQGILAALNNIHVLNLFLPDVMPESEIRTELEAAARRNGTHIWYISQPLTITMDDAVISVYPPGNDFSSNENDTSLLINVQYGEFNCLFTGDMTAAEEYWLLRRGAVPQAEVLKAAHHGSAYSNTETMLRTVNPEIAVICAGENNPHGHPSKDTLNRLSGITVYRTDLNSDIHIYADKDGSMTVHTRY